MDFRSFIKEYEQTVNLLDREEGTWSGGVWVPGEETETPFVAAIANFADDNLVFGEAGTYTRNDRKLFTYYPEKLLRGQKVKVGDDTFTITDARDYSFYARGMRMYIIRREGESSD